MAEIREVDREYIKSHAKWNRENALIKEELELDIANSEQKIDIQKRMLALTKERLAQNEDYAKASSNEFSKWLEENNISQSDLIDL